MSEPNEIGHPWDADGGPAFPNSAGNIAYRGMTLRDWFAGQALAGIVAEPGLPSHAGNAAGLATSYAGDAYRMADAMLAARVAQP